VRTNAEGAPHDIGRGILTDDKYFRVWAEFANSPNDLHAIQRGESEVEQDQIWLEFFGVPDGFQSVRHLSDDLALRHFLQLETQALAETFVVIDDQRPEGRCLHPCSPFSNIQEKQTGVPLPGLNKDPGLKPEA
jgi:hypothetical protein